MLQFFQKQNVLPTDDFKNLIDDKKTVAKNVENAKNAILVTETGETKINTVDLDILPASTLSKEWFINLSGDIQKFNNRFTDSFIKAMFAIEKILIDNELKDPKCVAALMYHANKPTTWHKHPKPKHLKPSEFWVAIFYIHHNWDTAFGGRLEVGYIPEKSEAIYNCYSNSVVIHNSYFGHGVESLKKGYEGSRDILLTHWVGK